MVCLQVKGKITETQDKTKKEENNHKFKDSQIEDDFLLQKKKTTPTPKWLNHAFVGYVCGLCVCFLKIEV